MKKPRICAVIVDGDLAAVKRVESLVELFEVRIDLIGNGWQEMVRQLDRPWIACNRSAGEGGRWGGDEAARIEELARAVELGAAVVDIELGIKNLEKVMRLIGKRAEYLLSYHDFNSTPPFEDMRGIVQRQLEAGANICKVVTTAQRFEDNLAVLRLITEYPGKKVVSFAMGSPGFASRILCPLVGGDFTYASIVEGKESASGQIAVRDLRKLYEMVSNGE